ncbi:uncharacterized protein [Montipora capricornis]|uniref:uncharacterized protein isoform X2 n=1 Tax=Montipora capricornis TaxID=246305 RepID=UPI0035F1842A
MKGFEFEFDEEIFGEPNSRTERTQETYRPKQCSPEWFMRCSSSEDQMERQNIKKFQGDLLYQRHQYKEALCMYQESQQYLSPNNSVLARELTESMAMCLLKLEKFEDALKLVGEIQDDNHQNDSTFLYLSSQIYSAMGNIEGIRIYEISALQRCALLHPWYYRYWFSLALAYEKASSSFSGRCKNGELCGVNSTSCSSCGSSKYSEHCNSSSDVEEQNECLERISDDEKKDTSPEAQGDSKTVCCANCSYFKKGKKTNVCYSNSGLVFRERQQPHLVQTFCDCLTANNELKLKWRKHVLSFGCLVKSRFYEEQDVDASSSFVNAKCKAFLREVQNKIATHAQCGCVNLIDKVLEMLHNSVIQAGEKGLMNDENLAIPEGFKQFKTSPLASEFEQIWFGDLLSFMAEGS